MAKIEYRWDWEADKPSQIHCPQCGFPFTVTPTADDLKNGFNWFCLKCGSKFTHGDPKPLEPKTIEPTRENTIAPNEERLGYPQTRRLFERKKATEWLNLMVGADTLDSQKISTIATKLKSYYRFRFRKNPTKVDNYNSYSGIELNVCIERMYAIDKSLANELQTLHLEKIRSEADVGSIILGNKDIAREVVEIVEGQLVLDFNGGFKRVHRSSVMSAIQADPTKNF